ncbi:MAG: glycosyltransferase family 4 protein [Solirubrobacterales bacterium]|nr:glycosyltransferase family 4 protein [Solirubrobacterales bacterium]
MSRRARAGPPGVVLRAVPAMPGPPIPPTPDAPARRRTLRLVGDPASSAAQRPLNVLYVDHTGLVGGGERSLLALLEALPAQARARLAAPAGPLQDRARERGVCAWTIAESSGSLRLHPVHTPLALGAMAAAATGVLRAARGWPADVLHANSIRAGLIAAPVARALRLPLVLHVRDCLPPSPLTERLQRGLAANAAAVIAISRHVAATFDPDGVASRLTVLPNPFDLTRLDPSRLTRAAARERLGLPAGAPVLGLVGQITPWKGQEEAIRALAQLRAGHPQARLLIVGEAKFVAKATRFDNRAYLDGLHRLVEEVGLGDAVRFLGEREDIPEVMRACDVALTPSWEEPFGRVVVEAMAMGVPVVATAAGGPAEIITDGRDGLLVTPRRPDLLAAAIERLLDDADLRDALGTAARRTASGYGAQRHVAGVMGVYRSVVRSERKFGATPFV